MLSNAIKNLIKAYNRSVIASSRRYLASHKDINQIRSQEEEAALEIEANLFDNSSVKYEPVKKADIIRGQRHLKKQPINNIMSRSKTFPGLEKKRSEQVVESKLINDQDLGLEYLKLSFNDHRLSNLLILVRSKKRRDKQRQIIIEGRRLILEALTCGLKLNSIIFSKKEKLLDISKDICQAQKVFSTKIYKVPHHDLKTWSTLNTPPGVMAIFERPHINGMDGKASSGFGPLPISVVCDNIREPNNMGGIIRVCAALPCLQVLITRGCCDPWESKALRGGCGGHFRLPIRDDVEWKDVPLMIPPEAADDYFIFVAENNLEKLHYDTPIAEYSEVRKTGSHNVVIIGGESHGVSEDAYRFMESVGQRGKCLYIPVAEGIDSLNVASALTLILYELRKNIFR